MRYAAAGGRVMKAPFDSYLPSQIGDVIVNPRNPENPVNPDSNALIKNDTFITHPLSAALRIGEKMNNE